MANYTWKSNLANHMHDYLALKRLTGFKYELEEYLLHLFDEYCYDNNINSEQLEPEFINGFCYGNRYDSRSTLYKKENVLNGFAAYLCSIGRTSYICPKKHIRKGECSYVPHIFSDDELKRLFNAIDTVPAHVQSNRHIVDPVLFRMLYACGMRLSEALNLQLKDVDLTEGTLTILQAKNGKDRIIPMATSLTERCKRYNGEFHPFSNKHTYYFKSILGRQLDTSTTYTRFREYLWYAGIEHLGRGHGPRIHDLRHSYCVHCLKRWVLEGKDVTNLFPYLSVYLGHSDFRRTQYYLRLTADLYPDMIKKMEATLGYVIPERRRS